MMGTIAEKYEFKLFLEGVKVDFISANVNSGPSGCNATISIPAKSSLVDILPRTVVQLFYKRFIDTEWRVLFDGEVHSIGITKSHNFMNFVLSCRDESSYLDSMYQFFLKNTNPLDVDQKIIAHYGAARDPVEVLTRAYNDSKRQGIIKGATSLLNMIYALIDEVLKSNPFFAQLEANHKFKSRIYNLVDLQMEEVFNREIFKKLISRAPMRDMKTLRQVAEEIMNMVYYQFAFICNPAFIDGKPRQIIMKPDNYFLPPPLCNVLLPNMFSSVDFSRNFMAEPTRLALRSEPGIAELSSGLNTSRYVAYAPQELQALSDKNVLHSGIIPSETHKGIIPMFTTTPYSIKMQGIKQDNIGNANNAPEIISLNYTAEYLLNKAQSIARGVSLGSVPFNPNLVAGFTGAIIVEPFIITGMINGVSHSVSPGSIQTSASFSYCNLAQIEVSEEKLSELRTLSNSTYDWSASEMTESQRSRARLLGDVDYAYPPFLSDLYRPANIDNTYTSLLGCKSIMSLNADPNTSSPMQNIRLMYDVYKEYIYSGSAYEYSKTVTARPIMTLENFYGTYLGLTKYTDDLYAAGGYFNQERQNVILEYVSQLGEGEGSLKDGSN